MLLGLVDQRGVGLIPYSDVFLFQIYNNQWEYTIGEKCTMYPYTETETPLPILSPCVSVREYRGSARRTRGLKKTLSKKFLVIFLNPSPQKLTFLRSLPYILHCKTQGRRCNTNIGYPFLPLPYPVALRGTAHKIKAEAKEKYISTSLLAGGYRQEFHR